MYIKRKEKEVVKSNSGLVFDFRDSEYLNASQDDTSFFILRGHEVFEEIPKDKPKVEIVDKLPIEEISYEEKEVIEKPKKKKKKK